MRIVSWNCNGALRRKTDPLDALDADVLVVQECEDPARSTSAYREWAGNYLWIGEGEQKNKGLGVFARSGLGLRALDWHGTYTPAGFGPDDLPWSTDQLRLFLPVRIDERIDLVAVWTKNWREERYGYIGQVWKFIHLHARDLAQGPCVIAGDFNSSAIWDRKRRDWDHSSVVRELDALGLRSLYHEGTGIAPGAEPDPTFYFYRKRDRPFHIDYVFASSDLRDGASIVIGDIADWLRFSDHMPLVTTLPVVRV